jgi:transcriptional regulator with XRE-family HTH domain
MAAPPSRPEPSEIGSRARTFRKRRGLSIEAAAGLAGISKGYLSMLERGQRGFERRGLIEDLADALGCAVADLTGQPYRLQNNREIAEGKRAIVRIEQGLNDATLDDAPDIQPRPLEELRQLVIDAARLRDEGLYSTAAADADDVLIELQAHVAASQGDQRRQAASLVTLAAYSAFHVATTYGYLHLAQHAAQRAWDAATQSEDPELVAFAMFALAPSIARTGGRGRAQRMLDHTIIDTDADALHSSTTGAEIFGLLNLMRAHLAAREEDVDTAHAHLDAAAEMATLTGERNSLGQHFGPTNVKLWRASVGAELGEGPEIAEQVEQGGIDLSVLDSRDRSAALHFDLARAYAQAEGARDEEVLRHLDRADRMAAQRIRQDPIARDILTGVSRRAHRRSWVLDSLRNRFGLA